MLPTSKTCTECKINKPLECYAKRKRNKYGLDPKCKDCRNAFNTAYRKANDKEVKAARKRHYHSNIDKMRVEKRVYCAAHREEKTTYDIEYRRENAEPIARYKREWEADRRDDPVFKIKRNLRRRVHHVLKGTLKTAHTFELIGCTPEEFKVYIESLWQPGMSWENYGPRGWHVDHIKECFRFDLTDSAQQKECFHYSNQRPLWAKDNLSRRRRGNQSLSDKIASDALVDVPPHLGE